jgi:hypothetical protein
VKSTNYEAPHYAVFSISCHFLSLRSIIIITIITTIYIEELGRLSRCKLQLQLILGLPMSLLSASL